MVRRFCAVCFLLLCLLIACAEDQDISPTPVSPPPTSTPTPSDTPLPDTIVPSPEPELRYPVKLPNGIPDIPAYDSGEIGRRYYKDTMLALVAKPDYGEIYPFIGAYMLSDWGEPEYLYGFCDTKGRIVCDPVYAEVEQMTDNGQTLYFLVKHKPVRRDGGYVDSDSTYTLAATDGSRVQTYEDILWPRKEPPIYYIDSSYAGSPYNTQYITVFDGKGWGAVDYGGQSVYPCREIFPVEFCEGLAVVYNADQTSYRYIDTKGRTVLGPYTPSEKIEFLWGFTWQDLHFSDGLARYYENGLWGYINKQGEIVIEPQFSEARAFHDGWAYVRDDDDNWEMETIDTSGNRIEQPSNVGLTYGYGWSRTILEDTQTFSNGTDALSFASTDNITPLARDRLLVEVYAGDGYEWHVVDSSGNAVSPVRNGYAHALGGYIRSYDSDRGGDSLFDSNGKEILPPLFKSIEIYGDYFCVANRDYGGLMDKNGNWIVKRSLLEYKDD